MSWLYIHCLVVHLKHIALSLICPLYLCHVFIVPVPHLFIVCVPHLLIVHVRHLFIVPVPHFIVCVPHLFIVRVPHLFIVCVPHLFIVPVPHLFLTGHYCLNGTRVSVEYPCPAGTFNNITGLAADTDCFDCLGTVNTVTCA